MTNSTWSRYIIILIYSWIFCFARAVCECTGFLELQCAGATLCCGAQGSRCSGFSCCGSKGSRLVGTRCQQLWHTSSVVVACRLQSMGLLVVVPGLSCSTACGIFLDQGLNPCPLHWQVDFYPLHHQGSPYIAGFYFPIFCRSFLYLYSQGIFICFLTMFLSDFYITVIKFSYS